MILLHNIGPRVNSNYNSIEEILQTTGPLSFDGVYTSVYDHREALRGRDVTLFVTGKYVGQDNSFDAPMPPERFCTFDQLSELVAMGFKLGYHTWSHPNLTLTDDVHLEFEIDPPFFWPFPTRPYLFAYPYGCFDARVIEAVKRAGYTQAWSVFAGDNSPFQQTRKYLNW